MNDRMPGVGTAILHVMIAAALVGCTTTGKGVSSIDGLKPSATASSAPGHDDLGMAEVAMASSGTSAGPDPVAATKPAAHEKKPISMDFVGKGSQASTPSAAVAGGDAGSLLKAASMKASSEVPPSDQVAVARPGLVTVSSPDIPAQATSPIAQEPAPTVPTIPVASVGSTPSTVPAPVQMSPSAPGVPQMPSDPLQQAIASLSAAAGSTVPAPVEPPVAATMPAAQTAGHRPATAAMLLPPAPPERRIVMITGPGAVELEPRPARQARPVQATRIVEPEAEPAAPPPPKPPRRF